MAISKRKCTDLRENGTGNLGATNTMLVFGKWYGIIVMVIDMLKAYLSVKIARLLFPNIAIAGLLAGCGSVVGHIFPLYHKFKGGKGLACFAGMILALDFNIFSVLLTLGVAAVFISDYAVALPVSAAFSAPAVFGLYYASSAVFGILLIPCTVMLFKHRDNFRRIKDGSEIKFRSFLRNKIRKHK
ncbi:MAG: glycerol-3-phosphate acyltransferase [Oscillospiraceae bacterium]|nr:glycerol-3-phosphate acyltransferase [Oscillospiraceae bacterium]